MKTQPEILAKLGIAALNPMQHEARKAILHNDEVVLLSPTGTGKTLAFLLPILHGLNPREKDIQALILVPSRELATQIEQVLREMGSGYRVAAVYGGRPGSRERQDLRTPPAILIGTPGRVADHLRRDAINPHKITTLVLDEFDKSLETGFEEEMSQIVRDLPRVRKKVLTSATHAVAVPDFMDIHAPVTIDYLGSRSSRLRLRCAVSEQKDKLDTLERVLGETGLGRGIVFCNVKDSVRAVAAFFDRRGIDYGIFMGGLDQADRERALIKFRNGTHRLLLATDLAARGIDVPALDFILHYQLPQREAEFTHRNGRTARMHADGTAYLLRYTRRTLPGYISDVEEMDLSGPPQPVQNADWTTLYVSGGRKDKISKGDLAGLFFKQGGLAKDELGIIELLADSAYVGVPAKKAADLVERLNNARVKKRKVRISEL